MARKVRLDSGPIPKIWINVNEYISIDQFDAESRYCKMLGHEVGFSYCRQTGTGVFCRKATDCWSGKFDVVAFLKWAFAEDQIQAAMKPPETKMNILLDLIAKARKVEKR